MSGLQRVLKAFGRMQIKGANNKTVWWVWDYANDKPVKESEMTTEQKAASEKAKYELVRGKPI